MDKRTLRLMGIVCIGLALVALVVAYERYSTNADAVRAMNQIMNPAGGFHGHLGSGVQLTPGVPAVTKYLILLSLFLAGAGGYSLYSSRA